MVRPGYKQTELGLIPEDWEDVSLGDLVNHTKGYAFKASDYKSQGVRVVRVSDTTFETIKDQNKIYIEASEAPKYSKWSLKESDLIISTVGSKPPMYDSMVGKATLVPFKDHGSLLNQNAVILRSKISRRHSQIYLHNTLKQTRYIDYIEKIFRGNANQASITLKELFFYRIPWPSIVEEQQAIAEALSDADNLINGLKKLIAKKQAIKTATMQQLLTGKTRLPGFGEGKGNSQTELGLIPEDWEIQNLGNIGETLVGLTYKPEDTRDFGTLVLRSSNIQNGRLAYENNVFVDKTLALPSRVIVESGDILICVRNGSRNLIGKCAIIDKNVAGSAFGAFMSLYRSSYSKFVFHQFQSDIMKQQINEIMGATINQITNRDMDSFLIPLPPPDEQQAIATVLSDMDKEISSLQTHLDKTKSIKQGMMQELLTGRTRLI